MTAGRAASVLALGLLVAACGSDGGAQSATTTVTAAPETVPADDILVTYSRSGGIAGRTFQVVVRPDGTFEGGSGKPGRGHLGGASLDELRRLVQAFVAAAPEPTYGRAVPDGFTTTVAAGARRTSVLEEASPPPAVQQLVSFLAGLERQLPR